MQVEKPQDEVGVCYVRWGRTGRTGRRGTCPGVRTQFFFLRCCGIFILVAAVLIAGFLRYVGLNLTCCAADVTDFFGLGHLLA